MDAMDAVIQFEGTIYEEGYGLLAQKVMRDKELPRQSKLIYAYMCSFASINKNGERTAFPSVDLQCLELGMTDNTYFKWRKPLIDFGYIKITKQRNAKAEFSNNIYSIIAVPEQDIKKKEVVERSESEPYRKNSGMEKKPYRKNSGMEESASNQGSDPYRNLSCMEEPCMVNSGTNINSLNINRFKDIDTIDTKDTEKEDLKNEYYKRAFYENYEKVPQELSDAFNVFCQTTKESGMYYKSINKAKLDVFRVALDEKGQTLFDLMHLENDTELLNKVVNTFVRVIRTVEQKGNIKNPAGYMYKAVYAQIWDYYDLNNVKNAN